MCAILLIGKKYNKMFENTKEVIMKKFYALLSFLIMIIFFFGCEFNLFEASVETNYKNIKDATTRLNYAEQVLLGGNADDISTILGLLEADFEKGLFGTAGDLWIRASRIIGNAYVTSSGVENIVTNVVTGLIATASSGENSDDITNIIADIDGNGTVDEGDLALLADMLTNMAEGAVYLDAAAQASPDDLDLQLENIIANLTAAIITVMNMDEDNIPAIMDAFSNYLETGNSGGYVFSTVEDNIQNAADSVDNILTYSEPGSPSYEIASALNEFLDFFTSH